MYNVVNSPENAQIVQEMLSALAAKATTVSEQNGKEVMKKAGEIVFKGFVSGLETGLETCDKTALAKVLKTTIAACAQEVDVVHVTQRAATNAALVVNNIPPTLAVEAGRRFSSLSTYFVKEIDISQSSKHIVKQATTLAKDSAPLVTGLVVGGVVAFGAFCGAHYLYKTAVHSIGKPSLGTWESVSQPGLYQNYIEPLFASPEQRRPPRSPVFNPEIRRKMDEIVASFLGLARDGKTFQHLLVYGPPGTGKTMVSAKILRDVILARNGKVNCIRMSGGDFEQFIGRNEHITELHKLFNTINRSKDPTILVIDEFEALGGDRHTHLRKDLISLQDAFLAHTGTETRKFMLITATNLVESLDPAIIDRFSHKIMIPFPSLEQRGPIISEALNEYFSPEEIASLFPASKVEQIARSTEGFSGRKILELISKIDSMRYTSGQLTEEIIDRKVRESVEEENAVKELRQRHQRTQTRAAAERMPEADQLLEF